MNLSGSATSEGVATHPGARPKTRPTRNYGSGGHLFDFARLRSLDARLRRASVVSSRGSPSRWDDGAARAASRRLRLVPAAQRDATVDFRRKTEMRSLFIGLASCALLLAPTTSFAAAAHCANGKSTDAAM